MQRAIRIPKPKQTSSFLQETWKKFRRHSMARWGGGVLLVLYLGAIFADFLAPYPEAKSFRNLTFASPTPIHWRTSEGRFTRPFICVTQRARDPETYKLVLSEDCSKAFVINFFVRGEPYKLFGFVPTNLRLMGGDWLVSGQAHLFVWGADDFGRDLWGRVWFGARVSLTVGIFAAAVALIVGVVMGGLSGLYAGRPMTLSVGLVNPEFRAWWSQRSPAMALLRVVFWLTLWASVAWLTWITVVGYLKVTKGIEAFIAGGLGIALLLTIGYFIIWKTVRLDLDTLIMRTTEVLAAIPDLFLLITLSVLIPNGVPASMRFYLVICILSFVNWGGLARTVRSQVLQLREMEYAQAAKALGASEGRTLFRHILPGTFTFLVVTVTLAIPGFILAESGLSFLGLGIQEPATSWGLMLANAQAQGITAFVDRPWLLIPGLFIFVAILAYNFLGDGLRDALDPRAKR